MIKNLTEEKSFIDKYESIDAQYKDICKQRDEMRTILFDYMTKNQIDRIECPNGRLEIRHKKIWEYPKYIQKLENDLEFEKEHAQNTKQAKFTLRDSLYYL